MSSPVVAGAQWSHPWDARRGQVRVVYRAEEWPWTPGVYVGLSTFLEILFEVCKQSLL